MGARIAPLPAEIAVVPGDPSSIQLTVRNDGTIVDRFAFEIDGDVKAWTEVVPAQLPLLPAADGSVDLRFSPPRTPETRAGTHTFTIRALAEKDPSKPASREGSIQVAPFFDSAARMVPQSSHGRRRATHTLTVMNRGNAELATSLTASDADEVLAFELASPTLAVVPGREIATSLQVKAKKLIFKGKPQPYPFKVVATTDAENAVTMEGLFVQKPIFTRWMMIAAAVVVALLALLTKQNAIGGVVLLLLLFLVVAVLLVVLLVLAIVFLIRRLLRRRRETQSTP